MPCSACHVLCAAYESILLTDMAGESEWEVKKEKARLSARDAALTKTILQKELNQATVCPRYVFI